MSHCWKSHALAQLSYMTFVEFWQDVSRETILLNYNEFGPVLQEMSFKDISYLELWQLLSSMELNHLRDVVRVQHEERFNLNQWFWRCTFKDISYLGLWLPVCSADRMLLYHFGKRYHEEQFCEISLNKGQRFRS